jgi:Leucine-rich repeat (LRR) protein
MSGLSSPSCASAHRGSEPNFANVRSELHRLTAGQFEELQARWADGQTLRGRVAVGVDSIPESLLNNLLHLPASAVSEALAEEALARECIARLRDYIQDLCGTTFHGTESLIEYIAGAPAAEMEERLAVAIEVVRTANASNYGSGFLELCCRQISRLPDLSPFKGLVTIDLSCCDRLIDVEGLRDLPRLECLVLARCPRLTNLNGLRNLPGLQDLDLKHCKGLTTLKGLQDLPSLRSVNVSHCTRLRDLEGLQDLPHLEDVDFSNCTGLTSCSLNELRHRLPGDCALTRSKHQ